MKIITYLGAALIAGAAMLPMSASAAPQTTRTVTTSDHGRVTTTRTVTRHRNNGWHRGGRWQTKCKTSWHHGRRYRSCRRAHW